ncbi:arylsulfatase A-like enzyme [Sphingobium wenxiniae]|uniref:Arylsulfatase A-like enzyme n=1 Tax=Sphingobium wenxiniae (strain DSM 21828 / CGMCC 1.7748 / JZ-1) TaxID=595605 RepID=A0A562JXH7_SPHWJ|nr:sulfatase-like hydrolase/transferase [Sphingobium wenxiniae]MBB6193781.1 arylsulfatase A-like enzyme [Sphingobium wenxiniae]TWH87882.1 arylsulfatase A-like enzyme [Sphingobium wenxiniae]SCW94984.1 Arylsulfatase A [Sphingobium faniae]
MTSTYSLTRRATLAGAAATLAVGSVPANARKRVRQPNILYIMADDLGYADLSCYGRRDFETPVLDKLAAQGLRFTNAYANSAVCTATRVGLITGRYQYRLPVGLEEPLAYRPNIGLPPSHPTLPSLLAKAGYRTSLIGKWHLGSLPDFDPIKSGYQSFWGIRSGGVDYYTHATSNGQPDLWDGPTPVDKAGYLTDLLADRAIAEIRQASSVKAPWFMSLHFTAPHWPWEGPDDASESTRIAGLKDPKALFHFDGGSAAIYAAMVRRLDYQIGRVLEALKANGAEQDTIVVFTSDNGGERFSDTWPFSGRKTELLEGGLRIPAIVRWPGVTTAATTSDAQIISMDWLPTFLAAAGAAPDPAFPSDGADIAAALSGRVLPERTLFWRYKNHAQRAARRGNLKYLKIGGNEFLFDVFADPLERANLKDRQPEAFTSLKKAWEDWNARMLPLDAQSYTHGFGPGELADHFNPEL